MKCVSRNAVTTSKYVPTHLWYSLEVNCKVQASTTSYLETSTGSCQVGSWVGLSGRKGKVYPITGHEGPKGE